MPEKTPPEQPAGSSAPKPDRESGQAPERPVRKLPSQESTSNRLRRLLGFESKPPKPPPGPPLGPAPAAAVKTLGSFFGAGFLPMAPGTWGSLAALTIWVVGFRLAYKTEIHPGTVDLCCFLLCAVFSLATLALGKLAERAEGGYDPKWFVLDELAGVFLALYGLAGYNGHPQMQLVFVAGAFLLFRVLDVTKLGLIGWADRRLTGGWGILMDDLFAGAAANLTVRGIAWLIVGQPNPRDWF